MKEDTNIEGDLIVVKNIATSGNINIDKNLLVNKSSVLKGVVNIEDELNVTKNVNIASNLNLDLILNAKSNVNILQDLVVENKSYLKEDTSIEGDLAVVKNISTIGNITTSGNINIDKKLLVKGISKLEDDVELNNNLTVDKDTLIKLDLSVNKNINCSGNVNIDDTLTIKEGLVVLDKSTSIVNKQGSIYFNNSSNLFMGYTNNGWNSLGGINPYSDTTITNNLNVDKNINCGGNVNIDDTLTIKEGLVVPDKSTSIVNKQGSIYFNNSSNLFMGYTNNGWNSLGGINPYSDTTITNNLNVDKNINCGGNVNVDDTLIVKEGLVVPDKSISIVNKKGSIYFNNSSNLFMGYTNNGWNSLGGINPYSDTTITNNLNVDKNINCSGNVNIDDKLIIKNGLKVPIYSIESSIIEYNEVNLTSNSSLNIVNNNGNKYVLNGETNYDPLRKYILENGSYTITNIPENHPIAILNYNKTTKITYSVDNSSVIIINVSGGQNTVNNGDYYTFTDNNSNNINIGNGLFRFMRGRTYKFVANGISISHPFKIVYGINETSSISGNSGEIEVTIPINHSNSDDLYYICIIHSGMRGNMGLLYREINESDEITASYDFYYGSINITVSDNFDLVSVYCYYHNYMGGKNLLKYLNSGSSTTNNEISTGNNILNEMGSIYYNSDSNLFMGYTNNGWNSLGGINPYTDTTITNNLIVNKNINCDGNIITSGILYSNQLIVPNNNQNLLTNVNSNLFVKRNINTNNDELKIILNNKENTLFINENNLSNLHLSTDIFQFYNVALNRVQIGNRINGLNDPAFNTFTKYYVLQEYTFHQKSIINGLEVYVSENVDNNPTVKLKIDIIKKTGSVETTVETYTTGDNLISVGETKLIDLSDIEFVKNDKVKISLELLSKGVDDSKINGHEIFCRLFGYSGILPIVNTLELLDTSDTSLSSAGGGQFNGPVSATSFSPFTGCHTGELTTPLINYDTYYDNNDNSIFKSGLLVSVVDSEVVNISENKFTLELSQRSYDKAVFGVINKALYDNIYLINSLGEGSILVTNITGNIKLGDYICSSNIKGYGCLQNTENMSSYTVAKCCSNINWNIIEKK